MNMSSNLVQIYNYKKTELLMCWFDHRSHLGTPLLRAAWDPATSSPL